MYQALKRYQRIGFFSLTVHIIKHIGNSEGEFFNIQYQIIGLIKIKSLYKNN